MTGEPEEAGRIFEEPVPVQTLPNGGRKYQHYCNRNYTSMIAKGDTPSADTKPTNARIKIFQRTETSAPRSFVNLEEVKTFLQQYTTVPISVVTTTEKQKIQEQIRLFNSFDILLTVHGSHLTNGVYMMKPHTKVSNFLNALACNYSTPMAWPQNYEKSRISISQFDFHRDYTTQPGRH